MWDAAEVKGHVKVSGPRPLNLSPDSSQAAPRSLMVQVLFLWENSTNMQRAHPNAVEITVLQCE